MEPVLSVSVHPPWERGRLARRNGGQDVRVPRKRQGGERLLLSEVEWRSVIRVSWPRYIRLPSTGNIAVYVRFRAMSFPDCAAERLHPGYGGSP